MTRILQPTIPSTPYNDGVRIPVLFSTPSVAPTPPNEHPSCPRIWRETFFAAGMESSIVARCPPVARSSYMHEPHTILPLATLEWLEQQGKSQKLGIPHLHHESTRVQTHL